MKNIVSLFFITTFLFLRIVDFHAISHFSDDNDDVIDCELCEIISISNEYTPVTNCTFDDSEQKVVTNFPEYNIHFCYETSSYSVTLPESFYNKPPPTFI